MAQIVIDIPQGADLTRAVNAFAATFGYPDATITETKAQFAKRQVAIWIKSIIANYEAQVAADAARAAAIQGVIDINIS
jgi:hypothetical protein